MRLTKKEKIVQEYRLALQEEALLKQLEQEKKKFGLAFYRPHYHQHRFHIANKSRRLSEAGNRSGKSESGVAEDCAWLLGERTWYKQKFDIWTAEYDIETDEFKKYITGHHDGHETHPYVRLGIPQRPVKGLVLVNDSDIVEEVFTGKDGKFWTWLPEDAILNTPRNNQGKIMSIVLKNGSTLRFDTLKSFLNNPQGHESKDWDFIHVDEPISQDMWTANARGLADRNGSAWFTLTPLREPWISAKFFPASNDPRSRPPEYEMPSGQTFAIRWDMYNNHYNSREGIDNYLNEIADPEEREARRTGLPLAFSGLVYKEFSYDKHILKDVPKGWKSYSEPPDDCCIFTSTDTHPKTDYHGLLCAVDRNDNVFIYRELKTKNDSATYVESMLPYLRGRKVGWNKVEPAAWIEDSVHHDCIALDFQRLGFNIIKASKDLEQGVQKVKAVLREPKGFYVSPECRGFIGEIHAYSWDKKTKTSGKAKIRDVDDHFMECFYRLLYHRPKWFDYEEADGVFSVSEESFTGSDMYDFDEDFSFTLD